MTADRAARDELFARMDFRPNAYADAWLLRRLLEAAEAERDALRAEKDAWTTNHKTALKAIFERDRALRVVEALRPLVAQIERSNAVDDHGHQIVKLKALGEARRALDAYDAGREDEE